MLCFGGQIFFTLKNNAKAVERYFSTYPNMTGIPHSRMIFSWVCTYWTLASWRILFWDLFSFIFIFILMFSFLIVYSGILAIHGPCIFVILTPYFEAPQSFLSFMDHCPDIRLERAINPFPPCEILPPFYQGFGMILSCYCAVSYWNPDRRGAGRSGGGKHKSGLYKQVWWMLVPKVLCLLSNSYIRREGCVAGMMNHRTAPWWKSKHRNYGNSTVAWIHHRTWRYRVKNNGICISLNETV